MKETTYPPLAIDGGTPAKTVPYGTGQRFHGNEFHYLHEALEQNSLFYGFGKMVRRACGMMTDYTGLPYAAACSSGSAAIHLGLIAAGIGPGDEVIVTPNTDTGSVLGIIEEGAVPVFCDCEWTLQPSAETVAAKITPRTKAVIVVHLAGFAAPVDEIIAFCEPRGIAVIEDCAQSWGTRLHGHLVGTFGMAGCFSTNDYKHISTGDGGFVVLANEDLYRRVLNYADKYYDRFYGSEMRQAHHGMNYRVSELFGAVACAQLEKVEAITSRQHALGELLRAKLAGLPGARVLTPIPDSYSTYWWTAAFIEKDALSIDRDRIVQALQAEGINVMSYGKYDLIDTPLFQTRITRPWLPDDRRYYPFIQPDGREYTYSLDQTPNHQAILQTGIMVSLNSFYTEQDIDETATGFWKVFSAYTR